MVIDSTGVATTVTLHSALTAPLKAVIMASPRAIAVTSPVALTVATDSSELLHVTLLSVASAGLTVAVSCNFSPTFNEDAVRFSSIDSTGVATTVTLHSVLTPPFEAVITASPSATAVTSPFALTVATDSSELLHVTLLSVASAGLTVAVSCTFSPTFSEEAVRFSSIDSTRVATTVILHSALTAPLEAVITASPSATAVTSPVALTVATDSSELRHVTVLSVASTGLTVAVSCTFSPTFREASWWSTVISLTGTGIFSTLTSVSGVV